MNANEVGKNTTDAGLSNVRIDLGVDWKASSVRDRPTPRAGRTGKRKEPTMAEVTAVAALTRFFNVGGDTLKK
jgi:hypothetical protein